MKPILREMKPEEAKTIQSLGMRSFLRSLEGFYVSKPTTARVAEIDGKIVGGFIYGIETGVKSKFGVIDFFFVAPEYAGQGIGKALCEEGVSFMWQEGCDFLATFVRDDNVGSWAVFEKTGFIRASLPKVASALGLGGFLKLYVKHFYGLCTGCDMYFAKHPKSPELLPDFSKKTGVGQIALNVFILNLLVLALFFRGMGEGVDISDTFLSLSTSILPSLLIIFCGVILFSFLGTLPSKRKWHYRMPTGGLLLSAVFSVFGVFLPMAGNWYPDRYENTAKFRRDLGLGAFLSWLYLIGLLTVMKFVGEVVPFLNSDVQIIIVILLIFRLIPFPVINLGSVRAFRWNKVLCALLAAASILIIALPATPV